MEPWRRAARAAGESGGRRLALRTNFAPGGWGGFKDTTAHLRTSAQAREGRALASVVKITGGGAGEGGWGGDLGPRPV